MKINTNPLAVKTLTKEQVLNLNRKERRLYFKKNRNKVRWVDLVVDEFNVMSKRRK